MKLRKKNNKGFSLIELIVVVLIMAIVAVALAPQVMKYVATSRISADISTVDEAVSTAQIVMTNGDAYKAVKNVGSGKVYAIKITGTGASIVTGSVSNPAAPTAAELGGTWTAASTTDKFYTEFKKTLGASGSLDKVKLKTGAEAVYIIVTTSGVGSFEYSSNADATSTFVDAENDINGGITLIK